MQQQSRDVFGHYRWRHNCARTRDSYSVQLWSVNSSGRRHGVSFQATPTASWRTCHRNENRHSRARARSLAVRRRPHRPRDQGRVHALSNPAISKQYSCERANPITATRAFRLVFEAQVIADVLRGTSVTTASSSSSTISFAPVSVSRRRTRSPPRYQRPSPSRRRQGSLCRSALRKGRGVYGYIGRSILARCRRRAVPARRPCGGVGSFWCLSLGWSGAP